MNEKIIPLELEYLNALLRQIDEHLLASQMPTVLRMRTKTLVEEMFSALMLTQGAQTGRMRATYPAPEQVRLQYRNERGPLEPDLSMLRRLLQGILGYGVKAKFESGSCTFTVGAR